VIFNPLIFRQNMFLKWHPVIKSYRFDFSQYRKELKGETIPGQHRLIMEAPNKNTEKL